MYEQCAGVFLFSAFLPSQQNSLLNAHPALVQARLFQEIPGMFFRLHTGRNCHFFFLFILGIVHHSRA